MKVIFQINGKSQEIDAKDIKNDTDLKAAMMRVAQGETKDVTDVLKNTEAMERLIAETKERREQAMQEENKRITAINIQYKEFTKCYNNYAIFMRDHNIVLNNAIESLAEEIAIRKTIQEKHLAIVWNNIREQKAHVQVLKAHPELKSFCKYLELVYKDFKKSLRGK